MYGWVQIQCCISVSSSLVGGLWFKDQSALLQIPSWLVRGSRVYGSCRLSNVYPYSPKCRFSGLLMRLYHP